MDNQSSPGGPTVSTTPETRPVPIVVLAGTIVHRASAVRQITGPRPAQHATSTADRVAAARAYQDRHRLDRLIRAACGLILVVEVVKTGVPAWLLARAADGILVAYAFTGR